MADRAFDAVPRRGGPDKMLTGLGVRSVLRQNARVPKAEAELAKFCTVLLLLLLIHLPRPLPKDMQVLTNLVYPTKVYFTVYYFLEIFCTVACKTGFPKMYTPNF